MSETSPAYEDKLLTVDVKNDGIVDGINENRIKQIARDYAIKQKSTLTEGEFGQLVNRIDILLRQYDIRLEGLAEKLDQAKQSVRGQTKEAVSTVRELKLSDIRSPAGLSHYIDRSGDEAMKILEERIGLDSTWKILALTAAHTSMDLGKWLADILKFWEGTAEWMVALDRKDLNKKEKALEIAKGIGLDGLRALGIVGGVGALGKVLLRTKAAQVVAETGTKSINQVPKVSAVESGASSPIPNNPTPATSPVTSPSGVSPNVPSVNPQPTIGARSKKPERERVIANSQLSDVDRIVKAQEVIGRKFSEGEQKGILRAHHTGESTVYNYTKPELRKKAKVMKEVGISSEERRVLMENGIAGNRKMVILKSKPIEVDTRAFSKMENYNISRIQNLVEEEVEKISNQKSNLESFTNRIERQYNNEAIQEMMVASNKWVEGRFGNLKTVIEYTRTNMENWLTSELRDINLQSEQALRAIGRQMAEMAETTWLRLSVQNVRSLRELLGTVLSFKEIFTP